MSNVCQYYLKSNYSNKLGSLQVDPHTFVDIPADLTRSYHPCTHKAHLEEVDIIIGFSQAVHLERWFSEAGDIETVVVA